MCYFPRISHFEAVKSFSNLRLVSFQNNCSKINCSKTITRLAKDLFCVYSESIQSISHSWQLRLKQARNQDFAWGQGVNQKLELFDSKKVTNVRRASKLVQLKRIANRVLVAEPSVTGCHDVLKAKTPAAERFL